LFQDSLERLVGSTEQHNSLKLTPKNQDISMKSTPVSVLIVADTAMGFSSVSRLLEQRGCKCSFARSYPEGALLFSQHAFDLVLCSGEREGVNTLMNRVIESSASLFRSHLVEHSCWWLPAVLRGEKCLGTPALRPGEFAKTLDSIVHEIRSADRNASAPAAD
jgi:hypothetical protein